MKTGTKNDAAEPAIYDVNFPDTLFCMGSFCTHATPHLTRNCFRPGFRTSDLVTLFHISRQAALKELSQMTEKELIQMEGIRRGAHYILK
jgi:phage terminase large subunit-like protein